jgi:hypothetical protein
MEDKTEEAVNRNRSKKKDNKRFFTQVDPVEDRFFVHIKQTGRQTEQTGKQAKRLVRFKS